VALPPPAVLEPAVLNQARAAVAGPPRATFEPIETSARVAAIQRSDEDPTRYVADHRISRVGAMDAVYLQNFPNWQDRR